MLLTKSWNAGGKRIMPEFVIILIFISLELLLLVFIYHLTLIRWLDTREREGVNERSEPFYRHSVSGIGVFIREVGAYHLLIFFHLLTPLLLPLLRSRPCGNAHSRRAYPWPIIFVPGWGGRPSNFFWLASRIRKRLRAPLWFFSYRSFQWTVEEAAESLEHMIEDIERCHGGLPVVLVGHSMGGLVIRALLERGLDCGRVVGIVTMGSPHRGTKLAYMGITISGRQMSPHSEFITRLRGQEELFSALPRLLVWSPLDAAIVPASSSSMDDSHNSVMSPCGHVEMLLSRDVVDHVVRFLDGLQASRTTPGT